MALEVENNIDFDYQTIQTYYKQITFPGSSET